MEGRGIFFVWRRREKLFSIRGKVACAVRGIEAFWQDDEICTIGSSFMDFGSCMGKIVVFVGT